MENIHLYNYYARNRDEYVKRVSLVTRNELIILLLRNLVKNNSLDL